MVFRRYFSALALSCGIVLVQSIPAAGQEVTLTSREGGVVLRGKVVDFDDTHYTIETAMGQVQARIDLVTCEGESCPVLKPPAAEVYVSGPNELVGAVLPAALEAQAKAAGHDVTAGEGGRYTVSDADGDAVATVTFADTPSTLAISDLLQGDATVALSKRSVRPAEAVAFSGSGLGDLRDAAQEDVLALDGAFIVTAPQNPLRSVTQREAARVFSGNVTNWSEIGGPDAPIRLYVPAPDSEMSEFFTRVVMRPHGVLLTEDAEVVEAPQDLVQALADDPFGIGITNFANLSAVRALEIEDVCGILSAPSEFNLKSEAYPLVRRLHAYRTNEAQDAYVDDLLEFISTKSAQRSFAAAGFLDQAVTVLPVEAQGMRFLSSIFAHDDTGPLEPLQRFVNAVVSSDRLSATFRFQSESTQLDSRGRRDVARLADYLAQTPGLGRTVRIAGFTDSVGDRQQNEDLSRRWAERVRDAVLELKPELGETYELLASGFGETAPIACNETAEGRWVNRRVEIWVSALGD